MRADEGVDIAKMAFNAFLALIIVGSVSGLAFLSVKLWNVFSREQSQNKINQRYAEIAAYDNNVVNGQDLVSLFMGQKGQIPIVFSSAKNAITHKVDTKTSMTGLTATGGIIYCNGYMGDFTVVPYFDSMAADEGYWYYDAGVGSGNIYHVTTPLSTFISVTDHTTHDSAESARYRPSSTGPISLDYDEVGKPALNGTLLPQAQAFIKEMYREIGGSSLASHPDVANKTYGFWYTVVLFRDESCSDPIAIYAEPVYYDYS